MNQRIDINVFDRHIVADQSIHQFVRYLHPIPGCFRHSLIAHAKGHHLQVRSGDQAQNSVIALLLKRNGIDHGRTLVNGQGGFNGAWIRAVDAAGGVHRVLNSGYQPFQIFYFPVHEYPGIDVALKVTNRNRIIERLQANEDDLYIMGQPPEGGLEVETFTFAPNPLVVMARHDHPLVAEKKIPLSRIVEEPFLLREPGSGVRDAILKIFAEKGLQPKVRMELGSNEAIKHAIVGGLGLSVLSLHTLTLEGTKGPVAVLDVEGFPIQRKWYLVYPKGKELSLVAKAFLDFALKSELHLRKKLEAMWPSLSEFMEDSAEEEKQTPVRKHG